MPAAQGVILQGLNQQILANPNAVTPKGRTEFDVLRGRAAAFSEVRLLLDQTPPSIERDALVLALLERIGGLLGSIEWLDEQLKVVTQNETGASFDSELSLVMWPDDYQLLRWQPNYLRPGYDNSQLPKVYRTLMVARLDAPTLALAKGLVDTAIKVEKEGLRGKVYIDARGIGEAGGYQCSPGQLRRLRPGAVDHRQRDRRADRHGSGARHDAAIISAGRSAPMRPCTAAGTAWASTSTRSTGSRVRWPTTWPAARRDSLRDPASQAWCKKLLEDGVCATIGPVYEPYLAAFPRPNEFFGLLAARRPDARRMLLPHPAHSIAG